MGTEVEEVAAEAATGCADVAVPVFSGDFAARTGVSSTLIFASSAVFSSFCFASVSFATRACTSLRTSREADSKDRCMEAANEDGERLPDVDEKSPARSGKISAAAVAAAAAARAISASSFSSLSASFFFCLASFFDLSFLRRASRKRSSSAANAMGSSGTAAVTLSTSASSSSSVSASDPVAWCWEAASLDALMGGAADAVAPVTGVL